MQQNCRLHALKNLYISDFKDTRVYLQSPEQIPCIPQVFSGLIPAWGPVVEVEPLTIVQNLLYYYLQIT